MKKPEEKTNVMRTLEQAKISYVPHSYPCEDGVALDAVATAALLGKRPEEIFKTLVTRGGKGGYFVFVIPGNGKLDLKKAAKAAGEKSIEMLRSAELLPLTGYVHGGCSPVGMKKAFPTFFDETVFQLNTVTVSAGKIGRQVEVDPGSLITFVRAKTADLLVKAEE